MKVAVIGECMLEISNAAAGRLSRAMPCTFNFGGDTLNTAVYMARLGCEVAYFSALGDDPYSQWLLAEWRAEGVTTDQVVILPGEMPGLYMIQTDDFGERSFSYWRSQSAAKQWLSNEDHCQVMLKSLAHFDVIYMSGITLSLMSEASTTLFLAGLAELRVRGVQVVFDINYRPRGWFDATQAKKRINAMLTVTDIALPTFDDEVLLFGDATPQDTLSRYASMGVAECVVKLGSEGAIVQTSGESVRVASLKISHVVDSTGAGDSFNAGYLARRLSGASCEEACLGGHTLAGTVIQHRGAIIAGSDMPTTLEV